MSVVVEGKSKPVLSLGQGFVDLDVVVGQESEDAGGFDGRQGEDVLVREDQFQLGCFLGVASDVVGEDR